MSNDTSTDIELDAMTPEDVARAATPGDLLWDDMSRRMGPQKLALHWLRSFRSAQLKLQEVLADRDKARSDWASELAAKSTSQSQVGGLQDRVKLLQSQLDTAAGRLAERTKQKAELDAEVARLAGVEEHLRQAQLLIQQKDRQEAHMEEELRKAREMAVSSAAQRDQAQAALMAARTDRDHLKWRLNKLLDAVGGALARRGEAAVAMATVQDLVSDLPLVEAELNGVWWSFCPVRGAWRWWDEAKARWSMPQQIAIRDTLRALFRLHGRLVPRAQADSSPIERGPVPLGDA